MILFFGYFCRYSRKSWPKFQSMSILAIHGKRQQETILVPKYSLKNQNQRIIFGI